MVLIASQQRHAAVWWPVRKQPQPSQILRRRIRGHSNFNPGAASGRMCRLLPQSSQAVQVTQLARMPREAQEQRNDPRRMLMSPVAAARSSLMKKEGMLHGLIWQVQKIRLAWNKPKPMLFTDTPGRIYISGTKLRKNPTVVMFRNPIPGKCGTRRSPSVFASPPSSKYLRKLEYDSI